MKNILFEMKTIGMSKFEKINLKFENILNQNPKYKYSDYLLKTKRYSILKEMADKESAEISRILRGEMRKDIPNIFEEKMTIFQKHELSRLDSELYQFKLSFQELDLQKIKQFISPALENKESQINKFIDLLGCENFKSFSELIKELEIDFLKKVITKDEINNLKKLILNYKGMLENII